MREDFDKLVALIQKAGRVHGRKKLQKMVYLLEKAGMDFGKTFRYHYYGPYCTELQLEIDALVDMGVLAERHNGYAYTYSVADGSDLAAEWEPCERNSALIAYLNGLAPQVLELAATLVYLNERDYGNFETVKKKALTLKPDLGSRMTEAVAVVDEVRSKLKGESQKLKAQS